MPEGVRKLLDLGAGVGVAGLCALTHNRTLEAVLAEIDPATAELARQNIESNGFGNRADVLTLDVLAAGLNRKRAGLETDLFDVVIANPPYFATGTLAGDKARAGARHMDGDFLDGWVKAAVSAAHARGLIIFIHTIEALPQLLSSFASRMGGIVVLPLCPRPGMAASRVLVKGQKGSRSPLSLLPPLILHGDEGNGFAPAIDAVFRGTARLDWHMAKQVPISSDTDISLRTNS